VYTRNDGSLACVSEFVGVSGTERYERPSSNDSRVAWLTELISGTRKLTLMTRTIFCRMTKTGVCLHASAMLNGASRAREHGGYPRSKMERGSLDQKDN
jgi:hypothetical protein